MSESSSSRLKPAPELLAPAGNWDCVQAAIENGADAVYFGLQEGFNARARAANFSDDDLPKLMQTLHRRGMLGYVTLNTLVFTDELPALQRTIRAIAAAHVDAVLVQDIGAARLVHAMCPDLDIHASTQMTMVSAETIAAIESLNIRRVVLARELSIDEIREITAATTMPVECFVHGALCVAYSGQCLTSESLGGRSANRGQCAQACRLNYTLFKDGVEQDLGSNQYLLSPQDLSGIRHIPQLIEAGVCSMKIEGRLKTPEYVANIVSKYREAIDAAMDGREYELSEMKEREMELSFSRGFSPGWLEGCDHKRLVPGISSAKRGVFVGTVLERRGERLAVELEFDIARGDGIVLEGNRAAGEEFGGRIYDVRVEGRSVDHPAKGDVELLFQHGALRSAAILSGQKIYLTDSPPLTKSLRASFQGSQPQILQPIEIFVRAVVGSPVELEVRCDSKNFTIKHDAIIAQATKHPTTQATLTEQLGRLGGSCYRLDQLSVELVGEPMIPFSVLGQLRRKVLEGLESIAIERKPPAINDVSMHFSWNREKEDSVSAAVTAPSQLSVLCRSMDQLQSAVETDADCLYADFPDIREYRNAVEIARRTGKKIFLATLRIQKPGEMGLFKALAKHNADGWLVRNLAAVRYAIEHDIAAIGDFSLNVTNPWTADWLIEQGLSRVTPSYDLNRDQLMELVAAMPSDYLEVVVHQHMPMFHMEHCVFCTVLSPGTNKSNCGRPCDNHSVELKDRIGVKHVLHADIGCRNTLYNGVAQSGAEAVERLQLKGVRNFRIELLRDATDTEVKKLIELYRKLLRGEVSGDQVWKSLRAENRLGVTRGTMEHPRNPLAIA